MAGNEIEDDIIKSYNQWLDDSTSEADNIGEGLWPKLKNNN